MASLLADLPDIIASLILVSENGYCLLDPVSLHNIDVAGGAFGRFTQTMNSQWRACFRFHFGWILGPDHHSDMLEACSLKQRVMRLWAKADGANLRHCGHVILVGGNTDRSVSHLH